ncbi:hypothetical protein L9F63_023849, partial [Diploptera punctata]
QQRNLPLLLLYPKALCHDMELWVKSLFEPHGGRFCMKQSNLRKRDTISVGFQMMKTCMTCHGVQFF